MKKIMYALDRFYDNRAFVRRLAAGLSLDECNQILADRNFKKLKKIIRRYPLSSVQFADFLHCAPKELISYYLDRHVLPFSSRALIAQLSVQMLAEKGLSDWLDDECRNYGMPLDAYAALMSYGDGVLIEFFDEFALLRYKLERFLAPLCITSPYGGGIGDSYWDTLVFSNVAEIYDVETAKHYLRHFIPSAEIQKKIAAVNSPVLADVYLGAENLYNRVIEKLRNVNISFVQERPYVDPGIKELLVQK